MLANIDRVLPYRQPVIVGMHAVLIALAYGLAFLLRFDFQIPAGYSDVFIWTLPFLLIVRMVVFARYGLYQGMWQYVSMHDILGILKAVTLSSLIFLGGVLVFFGHGFPRSVFIVDWMLCLALVGGVRLAIRAFREMGAQYGRDRGKRAFIVGAGDAGEVLIREVERNATMNYDVVGFVDDDPRKQQRRIHGIEVVGAVDQLPELCRERGVGEILIAIPSASLQQRRRMIELCRKSGVPFKTVPAINDLLQGRARISQLQEVQPEDLLGREAVRLDLNMLRQEIQGKRVLVTGAAGFIGSELCRQLATFEPEALILFERAESNLYFVDLELKSQHPDLKVIAIVGDILDQQRVEEVIGTYTPDLFYHTAAYKHVPLMEAHPLEAMINNIFGTENLARTASRMGVKKFVFVSTDKAVRPVGIMGMTKRMAECLLLCLDGGPTAFVGVRFGNVLGSDGSVFPIFRGQIASGRSLTVTDAEATRYFMLLSEAVGLVLQAGTMGKGGEIFFLDMGKPLKIMDLAENLVRACGMEPGKDIPIELIGLRPGERLHEELVKDQGDLAPTSHEKIFMVQDRYLEPTQFYKDLEELRQFVSLRDRQRATEKLTIMAERY